MIEKTRKVAKNIKAYAPEIIVGTVLVCGTYLVARHLTISELRRIEGKFITKADFQRMLDTDDVMLLLTPLGKFRVTPVL